MPSRVTRRAAITRPRTSCTPRCARSSASHVHQKGSLVAPDRLRFDFTHDRAVTADERRAIERLVNEQVYRNTAVTTDVKHTQDAIAAGAMALFGEKYGDRVRVVTVPGFSVELCGGTHVSATGDIGPFVITEESGVAAGVRRIEALTGAAAVAWIQAQHAALDRTTAALNVPVEQAAEAIARLQADAKRLARENDQLRMKIALGGGGTRRRRRHGGDRRREAHRAPGHRTREDRACAACPIRSATAWAAASSCSPLTTTARSRCSSR